MLKGNDYRLITKIDYGYQKVFIKYVLTHQEYDLRQSDLLQIFGSSGYVSDVVNGKRAISKAHAKALGEMFHVSPEAFI